MSFTITDDLISLFKQKMHITTKNEDSYLKELLQGSAEAIAHLTGDSELTDTGFAELVMERARYAYNDQLEYFKDNFQRDLMDRAFLNYTRGDDHEDTVQAPKG